MTRSSSPRKERPQDHSSQPPVPPTDYSDEVTNEQRAKLEAMVVHLGLETWEPEHDEPAW